jgi:hypothetical protein
MQLQQVTRPAEDRLGLECAFLSPSIRPLRETLQNRITACDAFASQGMMQTTVLLINITRIGVGLVEGILCNCMVHRSKQ